MLPEVGFVIGGTRVVVPSHALAVVVGVAAGTALALRRAEDRAVTLLAVAVVTLAALAGSHALFRTLHGGPAGLWSGGLASTGGVAAGLVAACLVARATGRPAARILDTIVPAGLLALAVGRVGCFLAGCCYGRATTLAWGVVLPDLGPPPRHPLQLYSAAGDLLVLALLPWRAAAPGACARRACVGFGLLRAGLECLRDAGATDPLPGGWLTLPQVAALALAAGAAAAPRLRDAGPFDYGCAPEDTPAWPMRKR